MRRYLNSSWMYLVVVLIAAQVVAVPASAADMLVYAGSGGLIDQAMQALGYRPGIDYDLRTDTDPVRPEDLANHDILIVGTYWANMSGINAAVLANGIRGTIVITGHDVDPHVSPRNNAAAKTFLTQAISHVRGPGTGLLVLGGGDMGWLQDAFGVIPSSTPSEIVTFTDAGRASPVYDGLTPELMSNWSTSVHNTFDISDTEFTPWELDESGRNVTVVGGGIHLTKDDGLEYTIGQAEITYTITYELDGDKFGEIWLVDKLPEEVEFIRAEPDPDSARIPYPYDATRHWVIWELGDFSGVISGTKRVIVRPRAGLVSGTVLHNHLAVVDSVAVGYEEELARADDRVPTVYFENLAARRIHVDADWGRPGSGYSWLTAKPTLAQGLQAALSAGITEIWVAKTDRADQYAGGLTIPGGMELYGGFHGVSETKPDGELTLAEADPTNNYTWIIPGAPGASSILSVTDAGGAVIIDGFYFGDGTASAGILASGQSTNLSVRRCDFRRGLDRGIDAAGAVTLYVSDCTFNGEGTTGTGLLLADGSVVSVTGCTVSSYQGNGIEVKSAGTDVTMENIDVFLCGTGIVVKDNGEATITNAKTSRNAAMGVLATNGANVTLNECNRENNESYTESRKGVKTNGTPENLVSLTITNCDFWGGARVDCDDTISVIRNTNLKGDSGTGFKFTGRGKHDISDCTISPKYRSLDTGIQVGGNKLDGEDYLCKINNVTLDGYTGGAYPAATRGLDLSGGPFDLTNVTIRQFWTGIYCRGRMSLTDSTLIDNFGRGLYLSGGPSGAAIPINNCAFSNNNSRNDDGISGAGMMMASDCQYTVKLTDCTFSSNKGRRGAGLSVEGGTAEIRGGWFLDNRGLGSDSSGGAVYISSSAEIRDCWFASNQAAKGGALCVISGVELINCAFADNSATGTSGRGGAVYSTGTLDILCSSFSSNKTILNGEGGAIYTSGGTCTAVSSLFDGNGGTGTGTQRGGAVISVGGLSLTNCTLRGNSAVQGRALYAGGGTATLKNCIVWGNGDPPSSALTGGGITATYSDIQGGFTGTGNLNVDPAFIGPGLSGPCTDKGDNASVPADTHDVDEDTDVAERFPYDVAKQPRVFGSKVDMGAYEFNNYLLFPYIWTDKKKYTYVKGQVNTITIGYRGANYSFEPEGQRDSIWVFNKRVQDDQGQKAGDVTTSWMGSLNVTFHQGDGDGMLFLPDGLYVVRLVDSDGATRASYDFFIDPLPPGPIVWEQKPYADGTTLHMTAREARDVNDPELLAQLAVQAPIQYEFMADAKYGGPSSGWQSGRSYDVNDVELGTVYAYAFRARFANAPEYVSELSSWEKALTAPQVEVAERVGSSTLVRIMPPSAPYDPTTDPNAEFYFKNVTTNIVREWSNTTYWIDTASTNNSRYLVKWRDVNDVESPASYVDANTVPASATDITAPRPNPMTWKVKPYATSNTSIAMTATTAIDVNSTIDYFFYCVNDPTRSSTWQASTSYEALGLTAGEAYTFRVKARDYEHNETAFSEEVRVHADIDPPTGLEWGPAAIGDTEIWVRAQATDAQEKSFQFRCITTSEESDWLTTEADLWVEGGPWGYTRYVEWRHSNLEEGHTYEYEFTVKDGNGRETTSSRQSYTTTVETAPPTPDPMQWADPWQLYVGVTMAKLQAVTASASGVWVEYEFVCVNDPNFTSPWQLNNPIYTVKGLRPNTLYTFKVRARKQHRPDLITGFSPEVSFTTSPQATNGAARIVELDAWLATIGDAVYEAADGRTIEIAQRTHYETLDLTGRQLTLRGTNPNNWTVVEATVINSSGAAPVITCGPDCRSTLEGLTITGANDPNAMGGGIFADLFGEVTLAKCIIKDNTARYGAGIYGNARVTKCLFENNHANHYGGGTYSVPSLQDCEFSYNSAGSAGGGVSGNSVSLVNCLLHHNSSGDDGGGLWASGNSSAVGCVFYLNSTTGDGGGVHYTYDSLTLTNCTFLNNTATGTGGGLYNLYCEGPHVTNCIFWGNTAASANQIGGYLPYLYSCLVGGATRSEGYVYESGNTIAYYRGGEFLNTNPNLTEEYHLSATSPCIDVGLNPGELPVTDIDGHRRVMGSAVDIGADEYFVPDVTPPTPDPMTWAVQPAPVDSNTITMTATTAGDVSLPVVYYFECITDPNHDSGWLLSPTYEDNGLTPQTTYTYRVRARDAAGNATGWSIQAATTTPAEGPIYCAHNLNTDLWYLTIQEAINAASNGHVIEVVPGVHPGAIDFGSKNITLRGTDLNNWTVIENTVIHGSGTAPVVRLSSGFLQGLTVTGGNNTSVYGGGVYASGTSTATISRCLIKDNTASYGAGVYGNSTTVVSGCRIQDNHATHYGGGLYNAATVTDCTFTSNQADSAGGGACSVATFTNCKFIGNSSGDDGGGFYTSSDATVIGCVFYNNSTVGNGGGVHVSYAILTLTNCTLRNNQATGTGGGLYNIYGEGPEVTNCIFWGNTAASGNQMGGYNPYLHSTAIGGAYDAGSYIKEVGTGLTLGYDHGGNLLSTDPNFIDEFHLACDSACIDKGQNVGGLPALDIDGDTRILNFGIEMGADEVTNSVVPGVFGEELDTTTLSFTTGGVAPWFGETSTYYYDGDAVQSGDIADEEETWIQTTVNGTGTVTFWWKVSSEQSYDFLEFYVDGGSPKYTVSGNQDWQQKSWTINVAGPHTLKWRYMKDSSASYWSDCGWLDYVVFTPTP